MNLSLTIFDINGENLLQYKVVIDREIVKQSESSTNSKFNIVWGRGKSMNEKVNCKLHLDALQSLTFIQHKISPRVCEAAARVCGRLRV